MEQISTIGIDLAKQSFHLHGACADGSVSFRKKLSRGKVLDFLALQPSCVVAMEACASAHYWGREIAELGHDVKLIAPIYVKPFVKRQKTDAEAISEAAQRPTMSFVAVKTAEQQASGMLFRTRDLLVRQRTQTINALRGHLSGSLRRRDRLTPTVWHGPWRIRSCRCRIGFARWVRCCSTGSWPSMPRSPVWRRSLVRLPGRMTTRHG